MVGVRQVTRPVAAVAERSLGEPLLPGRRIQLGQAGDEDEARRLESKAYGIGMEGERWYHGWFDPPKIRLALARDELGELAELASHELDWEWEPPSTLPGRTRCARRPRAN